VYLHLIFAGDEGPIKYASKISECVGAECFPQDMITDSSNPEGSDDEFVDTETAPTSKRPPLKFRSVELCTSFDQRAKVFEAWEKYDPQLVCHLSAFVCAAGACFKVVFVTTDGSVERVSKLQLSVQNSPSTFRLCRHQVRAVVCLRYCP